MMPSQERAGLGSRAGRLAPRYLRASQLTTLVVSATIAVAGCAPPAASRTQALESVESATAFMASAEARLLGLAIEAGRAGWVQENFITTDTEALAARANNAYIASVTELALDARRFDALELPAELRRKFTLLKLALTMPAPADAKEREELTQLATGLSSDYGRASYCPTPSTCMGIDDIGLRMAASRDPKELLDLWTGWHAVGKPMKARYERFAALSNKGAREMGFADTGVMWRSKYDVAPDAFATEVDRLWGQVRPLYLALHSYTRAKLLQKYGPTVVDPEGPIPAHLLGNMWAQQWGNVYPLLAPASFGRGVDITPLLEAKKATPVDMAKYAEDFFVSLGLQKLPATFWERSLLTRPRDREVVCHASAWSLDYNEDVRIKMCANVTGEDFVVLHHELGHNYYQLAYRAQPYLFQDSANDGFHEAIGDAVALSITPEYLTRVGLLGSAPSGEGDLGPLLYTALEKIAFLPFGLLVDQWRWKVFSGEVEPEAYNRAWWELRERYQGVKAPVARSNDDFDPGAKYHIPGNTPYMRYFLAHVLQFQIHRALCKEAGHEGPLHRCSVYGHRRAGAKLQRLLEMGLSRPWPDALEALSGERELDASAMVEYFQPLLTWLEQQNEGVPQGWGGP